MGIIFAPYGNSREFYETNASSLDAPLYLKKLGFNGYEYLSDEGVHISDDASLILGENAKNNGISLSVRAYKFLSLSNEDEKIRQKSIDILCDTVRIANNMNAKRVTFGLDNCAIRKRKDVFLKTLSSLEKVLFYMKENKITDVYLCPVMSGLIHNLGTEDEVISVCQTNDMLLPAVSAGDLYARSTGENFREEYFDALFLKMKKKLGEERGRSFHLYVSKAEYTHHGFREDIDFSKCIDKNQSFSGVVSSVRKNNLSPFLVVRSPNDKIKDLKTVMEMFEK